LSIDVRASDVRLRDYLVQFFTQRAAWMLSAIIMSGAFADGKSRPVGKIADGIADGFAGRFATWFASGFARGLKDAAQQ
jgi:hypothetical protein